MSEKYNINFCPECGTALGIKEEDSVSVVKCNEKRIWKDCEYCEGRGYLEEVVGFTTGGEQRMSYTCPNCVGGGKEPTDMVIYG